MRKHSRYAQIREGPYRRHCIRFLCRNPQPVHPRVHSHMDRDRPSVPGQSAGIPGVHHGLCKLIFTKLMEQFRIRISQDQDLSGDPGPAEPDPFFHRRHAEIPDSLFLQDAGYKNISVPVGICFHRRHQPAAVSCDPSELFCIVDQIFPADLSPGPAFFVHLHTPPVRSSAPS